MTKSRNLRRLLPALLALTLAAAPAVAEDELPYPAGRSTRTLEGLKTTLVLPANPPPKEKPWSLVIALHCAGGSGSNMADRFKTWATGGYVVCAPKAMDLTWEPGDLKRTLAIAKHLCDVLPIDPKKIHVVGYENGGDEMSPLVFHDDLRPRSAAWLTSGYRGTQVPRWAKKTLGVIAIAGSEDASERRARATVPALRKKVRNAEVVIQLGLAHRFPTDQLSYLRWWMDAQDGRIVPGDDMKMPWRENLEAAIASQATVKKGGVFVWFYTQQDAESDVARRIQHEVFFDPEVWWLAGQLACVRLDAANHALAMETFRVEQAPALVVLDRKGEAKAVFEGDIDPKKVVRTLKQVAPKRKMPLR